MAVADPPLRGAVFDAGEHLDLDLIEGIGPPPPSEAVICGRWPELLRLLNQTTGEIVRGRCKSANQCRFCQRAAAKETVEMLKIDGAEWPPTIYVVLTAREHLTRAECKPHLEHILRSCRKKWPVEWFVAVEFQRRGALHLNLLVKGVPDGDREEFVERAIGLWLERVDAERIGQYGGQVHDAVGLAGYLDKHLSHGLKSEQAPPIGWKGHRTSHTRGYLCRPTPAMREEARAALRDARAIREALGAGLDAGRAEMAAHDVRLQAITANWRLFHQRAPKNAVREEEVAAVGAVPEFVAEAALDYALTNDYA